MTLNLLDHGTDGLDLLGHKQVADQLGDVLEFCAEKQKEEAESQPRGRIVGLLGQWGSGKSKICELLKKDDRFRVDIVSLWEIAGPNILVNLVEHLADRFLDEEKKQRVEICLHGSTSGQLDANLLNKGPTSFSELVSLKAKYGRWRIAFACSAFLFTIGTIAFALSSKFPAALTTGLGGVSAFGILWWLAQKAIENAKQDISVSMPPAKDRAELIQKLLGIVVLDGLGEEDKWPVIVFDDLDRCSPKVVKDTISSLRAAMPGNATYVFAMDEFALIKAFGTDGICAEEAKSILQKVLDYSVVIPSMRFVAKHKIIEDSARILGLDIDENTRNVLTTGAIHTPRLLKKVLERMALILDLAARREEDGHLADGRITQDQSMIPSIARLAVVAEIWPMLWGKVEKQSFLWQELEVWAKQNFSEQGIPSAVRDIKESDVLHGFLTETAGYSHNTDLVLLHLVQEQEEIDIGIDLDLVEYGIRNTDGVEIVLKSIGDSREKAEAILAHLRRYYSNYTRSRGGVLVESLHRITVQAAMTKDVCRECRIGIANDFVRKFVSVGESVYYNGLQGILSEYVELMSYSNIEGWEARAENCFTGILTSYLPQEENGHILLEELFRSKFKEGGKQLISKVDLHKLGETLRELLGGKYDRIESLRPWLGVIVKNINGEFYFEKRDMGHWCFDYMQRMFAKNDIGIVSDDYWELYEKTLSLVATEENQKEMVSKLKSVLGKRIQDVVKSGKREDQLSFRERRLWFMERCSALAKSTFTQAGIEAFVMMLLESPEALAIGKGDQQKEGLRRNLAIARLIMQCGNNLRDKVLVIWAQILNERNDWKMILNEIEDTQWIREQNIVKVKLQRWNI